MWATSDPAQRLCQLGHPPCRDQTRASPISEVTQDLPRCSPPTCHYRGLNEPQASPRVSAPHLPDDRLPSTAIWAINSPPVDSGLESSSLVSVFVTGQLMTSAPLRFPWVPLNIPRSWMVAMVTQECSRPGLG